MRLSNDWPKVELVRNAVDGFVRATMLPATDVEQLSTAAAELLENALRHSAPAGRFDDKPITFALESDELETRVVVANEVAASSPHRARLEEAISAVHGSADLEALYRDRLSAVYAGDEARGLGLVRLGRLGCELECEMDGAEVRMIARFGASRTEGSPPSG